MNEEDPSEVLAIPSAPSVLSGAISMLLPCPRVRVPDTLARLTLLFVGSAVAPPRASNITEPFSVTLVVAVMRPDWLTAMPTSVTLPRCASMVPPARLVTAPLPLPTSTSRPRRAGKFGFTSEA